MQRVVGPKVELISSLLPPCAFHRRRLQHKLQTGRVEKKISKPLVGYALFSLCVFAVDVFDRESRRKHLLDIKALNHMKGKKTAQLYQHESNLTMSLQVMQVMCKTLGKKAPFPTTDSIR